MNKYAFACSILASISSVLLGYDTGVMSGAGIYIKKDLKISDVQLEILTGTISLYSLIGSFIAGRTSDWIGRRYTMAVAGAVFFIGAVLMGFATNYAFLTVGRFVAGIGVGFGVTIAPVYTVEVSPTTSRGFLTSLPEVFINSGVLLGYISNYAFSKLPLHLGWRLMLGAGSLPSLFLISAVFVVPESPRWLVMRGRLGDAKEVLERTSDSKEECDSRLAEIKESAGIPPNFQGDIFQMGKTKDRYNNDVLKEMFIHPKPAVLRVLIAGIGIQFFQQASGVDAVVLYSPRIFEKAGIRDDNRKLLATIAVGFIKTTFVLVATFLLDRVGRRPLLLVSSGGMIISLLTLATTLTSIQNSRAAAPDWAVKVCLVTVLSNVGFFSMGMGPIAWVYSSEIYPLRLRAQGAGLGAGVNRLMSGVVGTTFLSLYKAVTIGGAFFLFAGIATVGWLFFFTFLPETRGRTLEDMEEVFRDFSWRNNMFRRKVKQECNDCP